eukprot:GILI01010599.1.p1 GENE.GILI01010599.1~~GILI01010599.1.p1  ORF type:complete len:228 (-),score=79.93 GILI01010599.1:304-930(-)
MSSNSFEDLLGFAPQDQLLPLASPPIPSPTQFLNFDSRSSPSSSAVSNQAFFPAAVESDPSAGKEEDLSAIIFGLSSKAVLSPEQSNPSSNSSAAAPFSDPSLASQSFGPSFSFYDPSAPFFNGNGTGSPPSSVPSQHPASSNGSPAWGSFDANGFAQVPPAQAPAAPVEAGSPKQHIDRLYEQMAALERLLHSTRSEIKQLEQHKST